MVFEIDPLTDPRWLELLSRRRNASPFHTRGWLEALRRTYGYSPAALTTSKPNADLANGLVFCRVRSWLTGRRLVSIPFSDHCEPLTDDSQDLPALFSGLADLARAERYEYVELRPKFMSPAIHAEWRATSVFHLHSLDLRPGASVVFRQFHRDCIQRRILRARKEGIRIVNGRDREALLCFYNLLLRTRRRHGLPPQPMKWFTNVLECLGESATIRCAYHGAQPIAAIFTLQHGKSVYYKYGASDQRFHNFGAMPYLLWDAIQSAIQQGVEELDMGRTDDEEKGLIQFKDRWNAASSKLCYFRSPADAQPAASHRGWQRRVVRMACSYLPDRCLTTVGAFSYRHIG